ncbi:metallophosphoesterase MPPED2 [Tachysurus ichikawai]
MLRLRLALKAVLIPSSSLYLSPSVTQHYFPARNPDLFPLRDLIQTGCQRRLASISPGLDWVRRVSTSCRWRRSPGQIKTCINKLQFCSADSVINRSPRTVTSVPGTPWFNGWGFNLPRGQSLLDKWNQIPEDIDILMTHGPPLGFRDWVPKELQRVGCVELLNTVQRRVRPKLHVYGGIHEGYGLMTDGYTTFINSSTCTVSFQPTNPPIVFDLPNPGSS